MSAVAASAAALISPRVGGVPRRRLRSVPAQAGPSPVRGPAHPLALGRDARARLGGAARALLDADGLEGMSDAVRLAVIVLTSRTPSASGVVEIRTPELGRWLGLSASYVASEVVPALRRSGLVDVVTAPGEFGQDVGLECRVLPVWAAYGVVGHPLALARKELATLLRLLEAVMAPGWTHRDGTVTPAGLLGSRTGRGAATDRLALLLLVLEARETGRVRLCGGTVDAKRGRAAATLARLLGCTASAGERILERLEDRGVVARVRVHTASGLRHRTRLVVPAVAAAHGRDGVAAAREARSQPLVPDLADPDLAAGRIECPVPSAELQVSGVLVADEANVADPDLTAALHTDHSPVAPDASSLALSGGFSGEGREGEGDRPGCAREREDQVVDGEAVGVLRLVDGETGPLRGEQPKTFPAVEVDGTAATPGGGVRLTVVGGGQQQGRGVAVLSDFRLRVALAPVEWLWSQLSRGQQQVAVRSVGRALEVLEGVSCPESAPRLLAARLTDRLQEADGEALVRDPMGWLLGRGLVQRQACSDRRCDDGIRIDTGADCENCANVLHTRRAWRLKAAGEVDAVLPGADRVQRRAAIEERLRRRTEDARVRAARVEAEVELRRAAVARRRVAEDAAEQQRRAAACAECGMPDAAGLCPQCTYRRSTDLLVGEAVDLAVAVRADLNDPAQVAELTEQCEADTRALIAAVCRRSGTELTSYTAGETAERIREERRASAWRRLSASSEAQEEADAVYDMMLRRGPRGHEAALAAAAEARERTARHLLEQKLGQLRTLRMRMAASRMARQVG